MVSFHNVRLPVDVEQGAKGGPGFKTRVLELDNAEESRNAQWSKQRGNWDISYGIDSKSVLDAVKAFFYARQGRLYGFRFKDWSDYQITSQQQIGTGTSTTGSDGQQTFQVFKAYTDGTYTYNRTITRLVTGTVKVWSNGVLKTETTHYTVNYDTGVISFVNPNRPTTGQVVAVECEFDVAVRFDTDNIEITSHTYDAIEIGSMPIIELKNG